MYDVAIAGAGPVGSQVAYRLAGFGHKVAVFEQQPIGRTVCCTGIIGRECFSLLPPDDGIIFREASSAKLYAPSGHILRLERNTPQAYVVDRVSLDSVFAQRAQREGAEYFFNTRVRDIDLKNSGVGVRIVCDGREESFEAKTVVIASGFGSQLVAELGIGEINDYVIGAQAEVDSADVDELEVYFGRKTAPGFYAWLVPTSPGKSLVGLLSRRKAGLYLKSLFDTLYREGKVTTAAAEIGYRTMPLRPLPRTYGERFMVVGSAAGQVKPTTGGGVFYGLLCADIAADILHRALQCDDFSERMLSRYEREWKKRLGWEIRIGYLARKVLERMSDRQMDQIFRVIESQGLHERLLQSPDISFDWHAQGILRGLRYLVPLRHLLGPGSKPLLSLLKIVGGRS